MSLAVATGYATNTGLRARNEDFVGLITPAEPDLSSKGVIAAVADGVSGNDGGREAAEYTVRGLLSDYYATPDTWPVTQALDRVLQALNAWVQRQGSIRPELAGMATTLTCVVLRGGFYYFSHVGDTRLYLWRDGVLTRLTTDHVWDRSEMDHVLTRAIGLDSRLAIDHGAGELQARDIFLLVSDGLWSALGEYELCAHLANFSRAAKVGDDIAASLVRCALDAGSRDNVSVALLRVDALPEKNLRDAVSAMQQLPVPPKLKIGQRIDGYLVESVLHSSATTVLYRVRDDNTQRLLVLKTLQPERGNDSDERSAFAYEEWLARRVVARFFPQVIQVEARSFLYYLTTWHDGHTLQQSLDAGQHFTVPEVIACGEKLVRAIGALHRRSIIHRDIKPDNVHLGSDGELRILDLGVAQSGLDAGLGTGDDAEHVDRAPQAGTPSYLAPEQFEQAGASRQTDIYAAGVTLYRMLTRHYPYGEIEAFQHPRFTEPTPASRYRPDMPMWFERVLLKAVARDTSERFETAEEFLLAIERGAVHPLDAPRTVPLARRDPLRFWRAVAIGALLLNLLLLYFLTAH